MRKLENMGSIFIIPGKKPKNVETDDGFIDYDLGIGNLETNTECENRKCDEDALLKRIKSAKVGHTAILAAETSDLA